MIWTRNKKRWYGHVIRRNERKLVKCWVVDSVEKMREARLRLCGTVGQRHYGMPRS